MDTNNQTQFDFTNMKGRVGKAYQIARDAHQGQKDKAGAEYINHPVTVASNMGNDESAMIVALLHDVVEDTNVTFEDLEEFLLPSELDALRLLTHDKTVPYMEYIEQIGKNNLATRVKIADLKNNMDLTRLSVVTEKDRRRVEKYKKAFNFLAQIEERIK